MRTTNKRKTGSSVAEHPIIGLLRVAAEAQDDLALAYRKMGWNAAAFGANDEAREFRLRMADYLRKN